MGTVAKAGRLLNGVIYELDSEALDTAVDLLPTPTAADGSRGPDYARATRPGAGGDDLVTICARASNNRGSNWSTFEPAIRAWEALTRPAPPPAEPNSRGNPRLNPAFSEWMMGLEAGWVTDPSLDLHRRDQLKLIGNGVIPQQAEHALRQLMSRISKES